MKFRVLLLLGLLAVAGIIQLPKTAEAANQLYNPGFESAFWDDNSYLNNQYEPLSESFQVANYEGNSAMKLQLVGANQPYHVTSRIIRIPTNAGQVWQPEMRVKCVGLSNAQARMRTVYLKSNGRFNSLHYWLDVPSSGVWHTLRYNAWYGEPYEVGELPAPGGTKFIEFRILIDPINNGSAQGTCHWDYVKDLNGHSVPNWSFDNYEYEPYVLGLAQGGTNQTVSGYGRSGQFGVQAYMQAVGAGEMYREWVKPISGNKETSVSIWARCPSLNIWSYAYVSVVYYDATGTPVGMSHEFARPSGSWGQITAVPLDTPTTQGNNHPATQAAIRFGVWTSQKGNPATKCYFDDAFLEVNNQ